MKPSEGDFPTFLVWDGDGDSPAGEWLPVLWRGFGEEGDISGYSIPRRVEEQADALRARFLGWIHDLGEAQINGGRLVDRLTLRPDFSYWWMTLLAEKCNFAKSPQIYDAVRLLALEELAGAHSVGKIILASSDQTLARVFREWCGHATIAFEWRRLEGETNPISWIRRLYRSLPHPLQAAVALLRYLWQRLPLRQNSAFPYSASGEKITFVDYLAHLDPKALGTGQYGSNYWTDLVAALDESAVSVNWLHHYIEYEAVSTARRARNLITRFNQGGAQFHATLDAALGWCAVKDAVSDYLRIMFAGMRLHKMPSYFQPAHSRINLWPLFEQDWRASMFGAAAILNCLHLNLFERILKCLPHQKTGIYLLENMGWEMAFIHAWKAAGHGKLVGVPHATVRYWDLRYFFDPRSYRRAGKNDLPLPDLVALNGPAAIAAYRQGGFPKERIVDVEALRYLHLVNPLVASSSTKRSSSPQLRLLVLGDYLPSVSRQQMQWLAAAAPALPIDTCYIVKPHPICPINADDYPSLSLQVTNAPLGDLLNDCDAVYTGNVTSAAVEAYSVGRCVVSALDGDSFNMSPLRGLPGVIYVSSPKELADALRHLPEGQEGVRDAYFCLDKRLPRWRCLLGI